MKPLMKPEPTRYMLPVKDGRDTLGTFPGPWICFRCERCGRWGEYRRQTLLEEFGGDVRLPELLERFAASRGCSLADPGRSPYAITEATSFCGIKYRIAGYD